MLIIFSQQRLDKTVFIFPTKTNKHHAQKLFQDKWSFDTTLFLTMEELKDLVFISHFPILKEEKRTLAFYQALDEKHKQYFKIKNYFQSIELAQQFFEFWEEFNEELVEKNNVLQKVSSRTELLDWQKDAYQHISDIKTKYEQFIKTKGFEDNIFLRKKENINFESFRDFEKIVVVNQYYYTQLEKHIIRQLANSVKKVEIYFQHMEQNGRDKIFSSKPISLKDMPDKNYRTKKVCIFECKNEFSMITSLLQTIHKSKITDKQNSEIQIVDQSFRDKPYAQFLAINKFKINSSINFTNTSIFCFFYSVYKLIDSMIYETGEKNELLPIQTLLDAVVNNNFFNYILKDTRSQSANKAQEQTLDFLYYLIENDFKYIDLSKKYVTIFPPNKANKFILLIIDFIKNILEINSIRDLILKIGERDSLISIENIISENERNYSEIKETFFQALGDFSTIELLNIVPDLNDLFGFQKDKTKKMIRSAGLLKLFVDYLKAKSVKLNYVFPAGNENRLSINNLEDTRNISYEKVAVLNVSEDNIPSPRKTQFLFTEKQRGILGLKTYEEIREREKYYFFRLLLNSKVVYLFTLKNMDQNLERSSFLEEIVLFLGKKVTLQTEQVKDKNYHGVYDYFLNKSAYRVNKENSRQSPFFRLPLKKEIDFPENNLDLASYSIAALLENPFMFYVRQLCGLDEKSKKVETDFSNKLIGNIVHDVINEIWRQLIEFEHSPIFGFDFDKVNKSKIRQAVAAVLGGHKIYYQFPQNYSQTYFKEIIIPIVEHGTEEFFRILKKRTIFGSKQIEVIPEKEYGYIEETGYKELIPGADNELGLNVRIRGRADLRILLQDENFYSIFDYKTGGFDKRQLLIYELYYYLIEHPEMAEQVNSYFYFVFDEKMDELKKLLRKKSKQEEIESLKQDIIAAVNKIALNGFDLPDLKSKLGIMADVSRKDLYLPLMRKFESNG